MLASTVSSKALAAMATAEGFHFEETLTGFKWLGNRAEQLEAEGYTVLFAFEEAIGYMFYQLHKVRVLCFTFLVPCSLFCYAMQHTQTNGQHASLYPSAMQVVVDIRPYHPDSMNG